MTATEAIDCYTSTVTIQLGGEKPLSPGSSADFVLCDTDLLTASDSEFRTAKILATYKAGVRISG